MSSLRTLEIGPRKTVKVRKNDLLALRTLHQLEKLHLLFEDSRIESHTTLTDDEVDYFLSGFPELGL